MFVGKQYGTEDSWRDTPLRERICARDGGAAISLHATVLHQVGLDPRRMEDPGRKRLEIDCGRPIKESMA